ncbi:MAG: peptide chain release factor 2 [Deltaproteobacteria bacterium]|nr:peptide chain release factor 2 [Deltaproteobacteria bacterium]
MSTLDSSKVNSVRESLKKLAAKLDQLRGIFDVEATRRRVDELESLSAEPDFWNDRERAESLLREAKSSKSLLATFDGQVSLLDDAEAMVELAVEAEDGDSLTEAASMAEKLESTVDDLEFRRMLSGENDQGGAVVEINAGAGGVDAADWAQMLMRMVLRYCQKQDWKVDILSEQPAEEAGIRGATLLVDGEYAYGLLKAEKGVHRLVRISPFDANARRQTSFAAINVSPDIDDDVVVDIDESDLRIDYYRAGGAGGQHVNKTESAVRITHEPTGVVVTCQNERSQHKNKSQAMRVLRSRIYELKKAEQEAAAAEAAGSLKKIEWGSQIRSYVLHPYRQVTDHRTELKVGNIDAVLDGSLDPFIRAFLLKEGSPESS